MDSLLAGYGARSRSGDWQAVDIAGAHGAFFGLGALRIQRRDILIFLPQYIIMNLAISEGFSVVDYENLQFPAMLSIDYVRVYQPKNAINIGCDPVDFPTAKYIETWVVLVDRLLCSSDSRFL